SVNLRYGLFSLGMGWLKMSTSDGAGKLSGGITGKGFVKGQPRGAPKGNQNALTHGVRAFENQVARRARRGRSLIDRRTQAGKNAVAVREQILGDLGGADNLSAAKLILVELIARDVYFCDEIDRRCFK